MLHGLTSVILFRSKEHPSCPPQRGCVRAHIESKKQISSKLCYIEHCVTDFYHQIQLMIALSFLLEVLLCSCCDIIIFMVTSLVEVRFWYCVCETAVYDESYLMLFDIGGGFTISPLKPRANGENRARVQQLVHIDLKGWGANYVPLCHYHSVIQMLNSVAGNQIHPSSELLCSESNVYGISSQKLPNALLAIASR